MIHHDVLDLHHAFVYKASVAKQRASREQQVQIQTRVPVPIKATFERLRVAAGMTESAYARKVITDHVRRAKEAS